jgi:hypothetical protein
MVRLTAQNSAKSATLNRVIAELSMFHFPVPFNSTIQIADPIAQGCAGVSCCLEGIPYADRNDQEAVHGG